MAEEWPTLTFYQRFESAIALALTLIITILILVALFHLTVEVIGGLVLGGVNPLEYEPMKKEDLDISIRGNQLVIRAVKRSGGDHEGRLYHLMGRAYGRFERTIHLPQDIDGTCVSCITSGSGRCQWRSSGLLKLSKGATRPRCW
jgi:hypothetical protein